MILFSENGKQPTKYKHLKLYSIPVGDAILSTSCRPWTAHFRPQSPAYHNQDEIKYKEIIYYLFWNNTNITSLYFTFMNSKVLYYCYLKLSK